MRILVNAVSIREGGPLVVLRRLLLGMQALRSDIEWLVAGPDLSDESSSGSAVATIRPVLDRDDPFALFHWYEMELPAAVAKFSPAAIFSLTNYLPIRSLGRPAILLEQHAGHFSREFAELNAAFASAPSARLAWKLKTAWVRRSIRNARMLLVQTAALADRIAEAGLKRRDDIKVIAHGPGKVGHARQALMRPPHAPFRVGYITKFGVQKNFETLFRAVRALSDEGRHITLVVTLDPASPPAARVLDLARSCGISHLVENRGEVGGEAVANLYDSLDAVAFCSLCESFGFPMVEAMARALPIAVADTPENREVTGNAGLPFPPYDHARLANHLRRLMDDEKEFRFRSEASLARARDFSWDKACRETLAAILAAAGNS